LHTDVRGLRGRGYFDAVWVSGEYDAGDVVEFDYD
jgi:hypothetical protein